MSKVISGSTNIAVLDSKIIADLCSGKFYIDLTPSAYIGSGADNVLGAMVRITNPYGVVVKDFGSGYEIAPSLPDEMNTVVEYNIPVQASNYQYGKYIIDVKLIDADSKEYILSKDFDLKCIPSSKTKKYGSISASIKGVCKDGKVTVIVNTPPIYNGKAFESQVAAYSLEFPTGSEEATLNTGIGSFSVPLYEGVYKITGETCVTYNYGDNIFVKIKYKLAVQKNVLCGVDECIIFPRLVALNEQLRSGCSAEEKEQTSAIILDALNLFKVIQLGTDCGEDMSDYVAELLTLLNIQSEGVTTAVINNAPAKDFSITGCNVEKTTVGLTDFYVINNYEYVVDVQNNGGAIVVSEAVTEGCKRIQKISFDITVVYNQIKNIITTHNDQITWWTNIINKGLQLGGVDWTQLGLTPAQVNVMTLGQLVNYLLTFAKNCCECLAKINEHSASAVGGDVELAWTGDNLFAVELYIDMVFAAKILAPATSYTLEGLADRAAHNYTIIPIGANGKSCTPAAGTFEFFGCPSINPPSVSTNNANNVECPYDLTQLVNGLPLGITAEWHTANNTNASSLVGDPASVGAGVYYVFAKNADGCYSTGVAVTVTCEVSASCTAPQNLSVVAVDSGNLIAFQSATNPPPVYMVRRRLKADPDVTGSYTNIGNPVWNASTNRWEITDTTAVNNTLYTYRAESHCANDAKPFVDFNFANLVCPALTIVANETSIDYSFAHVGGGVDKYAVELVNSTGLVVLTTTNFVPAFPNPVAGSFGSLNQNTDYKIRVRMFIGAYYQNCPFVNSTTAPENVCPDVTGIGGAGYGGSNA